jgi:Anp1 protein/glycosyl transferase-like sugar-binding protein
MIPRIIHQTWKTDDIPERFRLYQRSWIEKNPGWTYRLWSDRALLDFVAAHYPDLLSTFCCYQNGVRRADAARYMLLHHFGGIYADIDAECLTSLDPLVEEDRIILSEEPSSHWPMHLPLRSSIRRMVFNGVMASPVGHPFWPRLLDALPVMRDAVDTLDATGPCLLSALVESDPCPERIWVGSCRLFNGIDFQGLDVGAGADPEETAYALHHWAGTWYPRPRPVNIVSQQRKRFYRLRHKLTRGAILNPEEAMAGVDQRVVDAAAPTGDDVAILVPVRDAADHLKPFLAAIASLDLPKERTKLVFCEGDSVDGSLERLKLLTEPLRGVYRDIRILELPLGNRIGRNERWKPKFQRRRRSDIAKVRNHLIDHGLDHTDDWALWIDIDMWRFPADVFARLRETGARIVTPNAVRVPGGASFDMNSFIQMPLARDYRFFRDHSQGLYQPPARAWGRLHLSDLRYLDEVELHGVGGTMLLVDAALHRGGLRFPELPYKNLIETEGFAALARDLGINPIGLPKLEVLHVPW